MFPKARRALGMAGLRDLGARMENRKRALTGKAGSRGR
jgi:hypothetical protein